MVASRICHDLISPMGAINNGLELLGMDKGDARPELDLISQSIQCAMTKLRFYRIAFGTVGADQTISLTEINSVLTAMGQVQKQSYIWNCKTDLTRRQVKLVFLLIMCLETALPWGGRISIMGAPRRVELLGQSERLKIDDVLWSGLEKGQSGGPATSARIQFALAQYEIAEQGVALTVAEEPGALRLALEI